MRDNQLLHTLKQDDFFKNIRSKKGLSDSDKQKKLNAWYAFLQNKGYDDTKIKQIINFYMMKNNYDIDLASLPDDWLGGGVYGLVIKHNGKAVKFEDLDRHEKQCLLKLSEIKKQNHDKTKNYIGKKEKLIDQINASKHINAPLSISDLQMGRKNKMISEYEQAKYDFYTLVDKQKELKAKMYRESWLHYQKVILASAVSQTLKSLSIVHSAGEAHGDLHGGNILVSVRQSEKSGKDKIKFLLHDRNYVSGLYYLRDICNNKEISWDIYHKNLDKSKMIQLANKVAPLKGVKNNSVNPLWIDYLQIWDLNCLHDDVEYYLQKVKLNNEHSQFFKALRAALKRLDKCKNATEALDSQEVSILRKWANELNNASRYDINKIL